MNSTNSRDLDTRALAVFLRLLQTLPEKLALQMPVLSDIAVLGDSQAGAGQAGKQGPGIIKKRLDRRHARICVVYRELGKLDFH